MTGDNCAICGERMKYEMPHSCAAGAPASNLPERKLLLVSVATMNGRIAEAVAAERARCARIARSVEFDLERPNSRQQACREIADKIEDRGPRP